jgi:hypothetical protein
VKLELAQLAFNLQTKRHSPIHPPLEESVAFAIKRNLLITLSNKLPSVPHLSKTFNATPRELSGPSNSKFIDSPIHFTSVRNSQHQNVFVSFLNECAKVGLVKAGGLQLKINGDAPTVRQTFAPHTLCVRESEGEGAERERGSGERGAVLVLLQLQ